jgi:hypothetical protein
VRNGPLMAQAWLTRTAVRGNDLPCPPKRWPSACSTEVARRASCGSAGPATHVSGCWPLHPARLLADHRDPRWIDRLGGTPAGLAAAQADLTPGSSPSSRPERLRVTRAFTTGARSRRNALQLLVHEHRNETDGTGQFLASAFCHRSPPSAARKRSPTGPVPGEM